jgi:hypothetical protein
LLRVAGLPSGVGAGLVAHFSPGIRHELASCGIRCFAEANGADVAHCLLGEAREKLRARWKTRI